MNEEGSNERKSPKDEVIDVKKQSHSDTAVSFKDVKNDLND